MNAKKCKRLSNGRLIDKITVRLDGTCTRGIYQGMKDSQIRKARGME